jgi:hypothetical protein
LARDLLVAAGDQEETAKVRNSFCYAIGEEQANVFLLACCYQEVSEWREKFILLRSAPVAARDNRVNVLINSARGGTE